VLGKLSFHPLVQFLHHWRAVRLVKLQPFLRCQTTLLRLSIKPVYRSQRLQHIQAFVGKALRDFRKWVTSLETCTDTRACFNCTFERVHRMTAKRAA